MNPAELFDPFNDRTARDIRNSLSSALIAELNGKLRGAVSQAAGKWLKVAPARVYRAYLEDRLDRYERVWPCIPPEKRNDPRFVALVLWNAGLHFEVHELLETIWHSSVGPARTALKALIQAAGVYVHVQRGNFEAAQRLARRSRVHFAAAMEEVSFIANRNELMLALERPGHPFPQLIWCEQLFQYNV